MWIFTNEGMLSIVSEKPEAPRLLVRARAKGHIEAVFGPRVRVTRTPLRDYRFRAYISRQVVADRIAALLSGIDYGNFKDSIADDPYHDACAGAWGVMLRYQYDAESPKAKRSLKQQGFW
jgi:hypothetical protein